MNLTIPIRAQNSKRSWSRAMGMRGNYSWENNKANRTRYIFSITTALLLVSMLLVGSIGGILQGASAKSNFDRSGYSTTQNRGGNSGSNQSTTKSTPSNTPTPAKTTTSPAAQTQARQTPVAPKATTPTPATTTPAPAPVAQTASSQVVTQPAVTPTPTPVDTAPAINAMTAAQTDKSTQPVTYISNILPDDTRNRIFILAGVAALTGALLYTISFIGVAAPAMKREIPIRYIVPVREGITS
jgi:hypothetical protein